MIFARFFCMASVQSQSLDQPLVPGVLCFITFLPINTGYLYLSLEISKLIENLKISRVKYKNPPCIQSRKWQAIAQSMHGKISS